MSSHLITGVAGFVGSHLAKRLIKEGHEVYGVDNLDCGFMANITGILDHPNFHFKNLDIRDVRCGNIKGGVDYVWHLAARGEVWFCRDNPDEALDVNVNGTLNILKQAKRMGAKHFYLPIHRPNMIALKKINITLQLNGWPLTLLRQWDIILLPRCAPANL